MMLNLARPFTQLRLFPDCSPTKIVLQRKLIKKETCTSPSVNIAKRFSCNKHGTDWCEEIETRCFSKPSCGVPFDLQLPATREPELESPKAILESSDADISFNVSVESSPVEYDHKAPKRVVKHHGQKMMYPSNCAESPGTSNDSDYVPELVELSEQRQIEVVCTYLFNFNVCLK